MDKYTVDLDKVLNDFEYSELTGQQRPAAPKHSINTVLHSLNEYLNAGLPQHPPDCQPDTTPTIASADYQHHTYLPETNVCPPQHQPLVNIIEPPVAVEHHTPQLLETVACQQQQMTQITEHRTPETVSVPQQLPQTFEHQIAPQQQHLPQTIEHRSVETVAPSPQQLPQTIASHLQQLSQKVEHYAVDTVASPPQQLPETVEQHAIETVASLSQQLPQTVEHHTIETVASPPQTFEYQAVETIACQPQQLPETVTCQPHQLSETIVSLPQQLPQTVVSPPQQMPQAAVSQPQQLPPTDKTTVPLPKQLPQTIETIISPPQQLPQQIVHHTITESCQAAQLRETVACQLPSQPIEQQPSKTIASSMNTEPIDHQPETTVNQEVQETTDSPQLIETIANPQQQQSLETIEHPPQMTNEEESAETDENLKQLIDEINDYEQQMIQTIEPPVKETVVSEADVTESREHQMDANVTQAGVETVAEQPGDVGETGDDVSETETVECDGGEGEGNNNSSSSDCAGPEEGGGDTEERRGSIRPSTLPLSDEPPPPPIDRIGEPGSTPYNNTWVDSSSPASIEDPSPPPGGLGSTAPAWTPDAAAAACRRCGARFTVLRRRHHCRACGELLCARCCGERAHLPYLGREARVCSHCLPLLQAPALESTPPAQPPPQSALKRQGTGRKAKSVTFVDGARPGSEPGEARRWVLDAATGSFLPAETGLPPRATRRRPDLALADTHDGPDLVRELKEDTVTLALTANLLVHCRILHLECCMNTWAWCFSTEGLMSVGQDEIVILLELEPGESSLPRDILAHILHVHAEAARGRSVSELGLSLHPQPAFLGSARHAGLLFLRPTFQCLQQLPLPPPPFLVGVLVHRWETPWARLFPLRLLLRLGALYRYYPAPLLSSRARDSVYAELGHTVINLLADFRNYSYTLPAVQGLNIHIDAADSVTVLLPKNRYDQVTRALANSSEHIVALGAAFSRGADAHLVCLQDTHTGAYSTHAINIHNKPRKVTGASFIVLNGALKPATGLLAKSSVVEDGVMLQLQAAELVRLRASLLAMRDHRVQSVSFVWSADDVDFNQGAASPIDGLTLAGVPSVRVHGSRDTASPSGRRCLRWTEVFLLRGGEEAVARAAEAVARAASAALARYLDLLAAGSQLRLGLRATVGDAVGYLAGSNRQRLPPLYLASLDSELVPVLHRLSNDLGHHTQQLQLELIFHILYT